MWLWGRGPPVHYWKMLWFLGKVSLFSDSSPSLPGLLNGNPGPQDPKSSWAAPTSGLGLALATLRPLPTGIPQALPEAEVGSFLNWAGFQDSGTQRPKDLQGVREGRERRPRNWHLSHTFWVCKDIVTLVAALPSVHCTWGQAQDSPGKPSGHQVPLDHPLLKLCAQISMVAWHRGTAHGHSTRQGWSVLSTLLWKASMMTVSQVTWQNTFPQVAVVSYDYAE